MLPELFSLISINLNDKEKIFLISCSKIIYRYKSLLILDSEYNLEEINDKWRVKNILIKKFILKNKIKELIENLIPESIILDPKYVKFVSNNINIKLFHNDEIVGKIISYGCYYLATKIILNNDESFENINYQFILFSGYNYLHVTKLLIDLGADIHSIDNHALINASYCGHLSMVKLLIDLGADIHARDDDAIIRASEQGYSSVVKLLIESGANIHVQNNKALKLAIKNKHSDVIKLLKKIDN